MFPGPVHPRLGALKAFSSICALERLRDSGTELAKSIHQTASKQERNNTLTPANGARSCPALPSYPAATGAALLASGAEQLLSVLLALGALREVSTAEPLNANLMVAFEMTACNCRQRLKK